MFDKPFDFALSQQQKEGEPESIPTGLIIDWHFISQKYYFWLKIIFYDRLQNFNTKHQSSYYGSNDISVE